MVQYSIDHVSSALGDPTRRAILERLARGPARISDIADPFPISLTGFCKHVRVLERAGLVRRTRRGRENTLELTPEPLREVAGWILDYSQFWNARLDRLADFFKGETMNLIEITVTRTIPAPPERVFDVWMDPKSPGGPWFGCERAILNPQVDGLFYHAVKHEGKIWPHYGRFIHLDRGRLIEFTWVSEATKGLESVVTMTLDAKDGQTEVTLKHSGVPDDQLGRQHKDGWTWILGSLAEVLSAPRAT
jgi:uncharacterized protein YndB with AHSA1/START domain/DNA-binding transcriptional ArsR family regulator